MIFVKIHWFLKLVAWCLGIWVIISKPVMFFFCFSVRFCFCKGDDSCGFFSSSHVFQHNCVCWGQTKWLWLKGISKGIGHSAKRETMWIPLLTIFTSIWYIQTLVLVLVSTLKRLLMCKAFLLLLLISHLPLPKKLAPNTSSSSFL